MSTAELGMATSLDALQRRNEAMPHFEISRALARALCTEHPENAFRFCDLAAKIEEASGATRPTP